MIYGEGLIININCKNLIAHDWMAFASYYSIRKNLPEAKINIISEFTKSQKQVFEWVRKVGISLFWGNKILDGFNITPDIMALDVYQKDNLGPISCKSDEIATFVSFSDMKIQKPFQIAKETNYSILTINEHRILKLWKKSEILYRAINQ